MKKGRRYMLPVIKTEKKKASGDNPVIEIKSESEDDESQNGWISSDEESPGNEVSFFFFLSIVTQIACVRFFELKLY